MMDKLNLITTPGGNRQRESPTAITSSATGPSDSGEPGTTCTEVSELPGTLTSLTMKLRPKKKHLIGTFNINTLMQTGKLKQLTDMLDERNINILALQETRFRDELHMDSGNYRIYKGKPAIKNSNGANILGTAFIVKKSITEAIINFSSPSERISTLSFKSGNKAYTIINSHAPINRDNGKFPEKVEKHWELLEDITTKIPQHHVKILVGDFNAQIGKEKENRKTVGEYPAHKRTNKNGKRLISFCKMFNLKLMSTYFKALPRKKKTWVCPNSKMGEFQIDHVAITTRNRKEILNVKVKRGINIDSDHYLSEIKVKFQPNKPTLRTSKKPRIDAETLGYNREKYLERLNKQDLGNEWNEIKKTLTNATEGIAEPVRKPRHRWWNEECDKALNKRAETWKLWHSNKTEDKWNNFRKQRKDTAKAIRYTKRKYDKTQLEKIDKDFKRHNTRDFYKTFKEELRGYLPASLCFRKKDGKLALSNKENCQILADYFQTLLNCDEPKQRLSFETNKNPNAESEPPTDKEIQVIIKTLKNNKAPGEDGIMAEMLKYGEETIVKKISQICEEIWKTEKIPDDWKCALIHPLHKKGDRTDTNNYRGISLLPVIYKVLSKALLNRIGEQADHLIGEYQGGFRKGRSCAEQIFNLKNILRLRTLRGVNTVVIFVDFKKAYDSIDRQSLFKTLQELGIDRKTRKLIEQTLTNTSSKVKFLGEISEPFEIKTGVRQGDGLSPILFNLILEKVMRTWKQEMEKENIRGIQLGRRKGNLVVECLAFADDIAIIAQNTEEARVMIEKLQEIAGKTGLQISYEKTEYMENKHKKEKYMKTKYGNIKRVDKFKYLGEWIQPNGLDETSNIERVKKLERSYGITQNRYNKRSISYKAKIRHYNTVIKPEGLYASECLTLNKKGEVQEIEKRERRILRKILGPRKTEDGTWKIRKNESLYKHIDTFTETMRKRRAKFYGHLKRMDDDRLTKRIFNYLTEIKATTNWVKEVQKDLEEMKITEDIIQNRDEFRKTIDGFKNFKDRDHKTGRKWTDEQKRNNSEKMKKVWEVRKNKLTIMQRVPRSPKKAKMK